MYYWHLLQNIIMRMLFRWKPIIGISARAYGESLQTSRQCNIEAFLRLAAEAARPASIGPCAASHFVWLMHDAPASMRPYSIIIAAKLAMSGAWRRRQWRRRIIKSREISMSIIDIIFGALSIFARNLLIKASAGTR